MAGAAEMTVEQDDAGIMAAAIALCWAAMPVMLGPRDEEITPQRWWALQTEAERRLHLYRARIACEAWEGFWGEQESLRAAP